MSSRKYSTQRLTLMKQFRKALSELEFVQNFAPKESSVYFLMGKICKKVVSQDLCLDSRLSTRYTGGN